MVDRRKTIRRLVVAAVASLALVLGVLAVPSLGTSLGISQGIGRHGNLPGVYDASKKVAAAAAPNADPESLPHVHNNPKTKNDISRGGEVGKSVQDPTNAAQRALAAGYVAQS